MSMQVNPAIIVSSYRAKVFLAILAMVPLCVVSKSPTRAAEPTVLEVPNAEAATQADMKPYAEAIEHTDVTIEMVPIPGGKFMMGSPDTEEYRGEDEGPQFEVQVEPFWMGKYEITWDAMEVWMFDLDIQRRDLAKDAATAFDLAAEEYQLSQPTEPYTDMTFGMGKKNRPAICMTQLAAKVFCKWLSAKTGRYYRLPTEAEWEYACRAGSTTAYHFGDDPAQLEQYGWYYDNADESYQEVGQLKPNAWGLHDMHGNVAEWVLDQYIPDHYSQFEGKSVKASEALATPTTIWQRVIRGGSWDDDPDRLRSAARAFSEEEWNMQDPQIPQSMWYHTDALHVGFRIIRPLQVPSEQEQQETWDKSEPVQDRKAGR
jgi:formylglycine-generating enzyme required for sulfatase activity